MIWAGFRQWDELESDGESVSGFFVSGLGVTLVLRPVLIVESKWAPVGAYTLGECRGGNLLVSVPVAGLRCRRDCSSFK